MLIWTFEVDGDLDESIKRSASDRLGDLVPQVRARTSPGVFRDMALLGLCLELSFNVLYCRTQANLPTLTLCMVFEQNALIFFLLSACFFSSWSKKLHCRYAYTYFLDIYGTLEQSKEHSRLEF